MHQMGLGTQVIVMAFI